jgi:hypothetical protein
MIFDLLMEILVSGRDGPLGGIVQGRIVSQAVFNLTLHGFGDVRLGSDQDGRLSRGAFPAAPWDL